MLLALAAAALAPSALVTEPLYEDAEFGKQMTVDEIRRDLVGNSLSWWVSDARRVRFIAPDGSFRGGGTKLSWHFRGYDNLFCVESGDPVSSGCVQLLRSGNRITFRRKDGMIEVTATLEQGNPFGK